MPDMQPASLHGYEVRWAAGGNYPLIREQTAAHANGFLLRDLSDEAEARLDFYEAGFGYDLRNITVMLDGESTPARAYFPTSDLAPGPEWSLDDWARDHWPLTQFSAAEIMGYFGRVPASNMAARFPMILTRAASRLRAQNNPAPARLRSGQARDQVDEKQRRIPHEGFFLSAESNLSFRRFNGAMSADVTRMGFIGADAAMVLPYDPVTDLILVIEQFRYGPFLRGDPRPWTLEPVAGLIDPGETPQECARREALEEAGLTLNALEPVADYYPSPGANSDFFYSYIGLADLSLEMAGIGGVEAEAEDIRSHILPFDELMELVSSGEAGCGPLVLCALWLAANRSRLRAAA